MLKNMNFTLNVKTSNFVGQTFTSNNISYVRKIISEMMNIDFVNMGQYVISSNENNNVLEYYKDSENNTSYIVTIGTA